MLRRFSGDNPLKITVEYARTRQAVPRLTHDLDFLNDGPKPADDPNKPMRNTLELSKRYEWTVTSG